MVMQATRLVTKPWLIECNTPNLSKFSCHILNYTYIYIATLAKILKTTRSSQPIIKMQGTLPRIVLPYIVTIIYIGMSYSKTKYMCSCMYGTA